MGKKKIKVENELLEIWNDFKADNVIQHYYRKGKSYDRCYYNPFIWFRILRFWTLKAKMDDLKKQLKIWEKYERITKG